MSIARRPIRQPRNPAMSSLCRSALRFARPNPLAVCFAAAFACSTTGGAAAPYAPELGPLPPLKAQAVLRARSRPAMRRPAATSVVTHCADSGAGSLRDAMNHAADLDTIDLSQLACSRITLTTGALLADVDNLTLIGPADRHVTIDGGASAMHYNNAIIHGGSGLLTVQDLVVSDAKYQDGAGLGGCIWSNGSIYLHRTIVSGCTVSNTTDSGDASGAGVWANKNVIAIQSVITGNIALSENGAALGAGLYAKGDVNSFYCTVSDNNAQGISSEGGGLFIEGSLGMSNSTVSGNDAQIGGGLFLDGRNQTFTSNIVSSTFSGNNAEEVGGIFTRVGAQFTTDTIAFNTETNAAGAGLYCEGASSIDSTIILANTHQGAESDLAGASGASVSGSHNMLASFTTTLTLPAGFYIPGAPFDLAPLADNGGPTRTHNLPPGSEAIDHGGVEETPYDQRGHAFSREYGNATDIGALEYDSDVIFVNGFN
jgi:hypothetical protein